MAVTWKDACELIAKYLNAKTGESVTAQQVFNYSPSGELAMIPFLYQEAVEYFKENQPN